MKDLHILRTDKIYKKQEEIPFYKKQTRLALRTLWTYRCNFNRRIYCIWMDISAFEKALFDMNSEEVIKEIEEVKFKRTWRRWISQQVVNGLR